jgi:hypothetical protein
MKGCIIVVYYESRKRELKIRLMNEGICEGGICFCFSLSFFFFSVVPPLEVMEKTGKAQ